MPTAFLNYLALKMALNGYSIDNIKKWAGQHFPDEFKQLPGPRFFRLRRDIVLGYGRFNNFQSMVIGTVHNDKYDGVEVLAWLEDGFTQIGYVRPNAAGRN